MQGQLEAVQKPGAWEYESDEEEMGNLVCIGDNFVVPTLEGNNEKVELYVLQCQRLVHVVTNNYCRYLL